MPKTPTPSAEALRIEYMTLAELSRWPGNPKQHAEAAIAASIERFGFRDPIAIDEASGRIVSGHGRLSVLEQAYEAGSPPPRYIKVDKDDNWLVPVTRGGTFEDEAEAAAFLVATNKTVELGGWDDAALAELLRGLNDDLQSLTGFDSDELDALLADAATAPDPTAFLSDLSSYSPPSSAQDSEQETDNSEQDGGDSEPQAEDVPYFQVSYTLPRADRDTALSAIKDARERFGLSTSPEAFMHIVTHYIKTVKEPS